MKITRSEEEYTRPIKMINLRKYRIILFRRGLRIMKIKRIYEINEND